MFKLSRMKPLLSLSSSLSNTTATATFSPYFILSHPSILCRTTTKFKPIKNPIFLHTASVINSLANYSKVSNYSHSRGLCSESVASGEIHVIVGPMFAGKTTTLLKRMKTERINGRFQGNTLKEYKKGRRIHWQMVVIAFIPDEHIKIKLLILYAKSGDLDAAEVLFNGLVIKNLIPWNALIAGYVQKGLEELGLSLFRKMRQYGWMPDQYTFASILRACSSLAILEQGKQAHGILSKSQINENLVVNSALIDMYFKCSSPHDGFRMFDKSLERNVVTWSSLISGYGLHGRVFDVLDCFHQMINEGFNPNQVTFVAVLSACSHGGLVDKGRLMPLSRRRLIKITRQYGVRCLVRVEFMGMWTLDMIKLAAKNFCEWEPDNAGKYIVLCNAFASSGLWKNVAEIRNVMKGSGTKKEPGYSMIEVQTEVHFFVMGHNTHKRTEQIHEWIRDLTCVLKDAEVGGDPDPSHQKSWIRPCSIVTHDGEKLPCLPLADLSSFREKLGAQEYDKLQVIGIDEAQFFGDLYDFCSQAADHDGKTVIVAGLDGDYLRRSFGSVLDLIPIADSVTKLTARCEACGKRAFFTLRKTDETRTEVIGGAEVYMPVCRKHYINGQVVKEDAKVVPESDNRLISSVF
ncbi:hypothetical protein OROGR_001216 [Orobanche gracilis]